LTWPHLRTSHLAPRTSHLALHQHTHLAFWNANLVGTCASTRIAPICA
jgi:hypothetical protein